LSFCSSNNAAVVFIRLISTLTEKKYCLQMENSCRFWNNKCSDCWSASRFDYW